MPHTTYGLLIQDNMALIAPSNLVTEKLANGVKLTWDDNSTGEYGFEIYTSLSGGAFTLLTTTAANITTYTHVCTDGDDRMYKVRAKGSKNLSDYTPVKSAVKVFGSEMINQSTWYTAAYWTTFNANWSQVGTTLVSNGTGWLQLTGFWGNGKIYKCTMTVTVTSGAIKFPYDGANDSIAPTTSGTYTAYFYVRPANVTLYIRASAFVGSITSMSIQEVTGTQAVGNFKFDAGTAWSLGSGHTVSSNLLNISAASASETTQALTGMEAGETYFVVCNILSRTSGTLEVKIGLDAAVSRTAIGYFTFYHKYDGTNNILSIKNTNAAIMTLNVVSATKVTYAIT